jgi:ribosomal protein S18 acetylase RimI-like enzyme
MRTMLNFRSSEKSDIGQIAELHNELIRFIQEETKDVYWESLNVSIESAQSYINSFLEKEHARIFICKNESTIVGFIAGEVIDCHLPLSAIQKVGYISGAYVKKEFRGKGVLRNLENMIIEYFRKLKIEYIELNYLVENVIAGKSWTKLGYKPYRMCARKKI